MSAENKKDNDKMGLFTQGRNVEIDRAIDAAEVALINSEKFLSEIRTSEAAARAYVEEIQTRIEEQLGELRSRKEFLLKDSQG